jgi:hypothetical protein
MRTRTLTLAVLLGLAPALGAQSPSRRVTPEVRPLVGAYVPTGSMRDAFEPATMLGAQFGLELSRNFHVLATGTWTQGHNNFDFSTDRVNIWQYDVGVEGNLIRPLGEEWLFRPFLGVGAGGRTYDYRAGGVDTKSCTAGYAALGSEFETGAYALRAEARDYLSCFESPVTGEKQTRNDFGLSLGVAYHVR